jgi:hypothetical protein
LRLFKARIETGSGIDLNQRMATLSLQAGQLQLLPQKSDEVTTAQTQAIESRRQGKESKGE